MKKKRKATVSIDGMTCEVKPMEELEADLAKIEAEMSKSGVRPVRVVVPEDIASRLARRREEYSPEGTADGADDCESDDKYPAENVHGNDCRLD